ARPAPQHAHSYLDSPRRSGSSPHAQCTAPCGATPEGSIRPTRRLWSFTLGRTTRGISGKYQTVHGPYLTSKLHRDTRRAPSAKSRLSADGRLLTTPTASAIIRPLVH